MTSIGFWLSDGGGLSDSVFLVFEIMEVFLVLN